MKKNIHAPVNKKHVRISSGKTAPGAIEKFKVLE